MNEKKMVEAIDNVEKFLANAMANEMKSCGFRSILRMKDSDAKLLNDLGDAFDSFREVCIGMAKHFDDQEEKLKAIDSKLDKIYSCIQDPILNKKGIGNVESK